MIDHDLYLLDVLKVDGETEDDLDERLKTEAKQVGLDIEVDHVADSKHLFRTYRSEYSRRSESIDSRASQSTGPASTFSDCPKDQTIYDSQPHRSRASLSFRDYDSFVARGVPNGRHSISFSPLSTPSYSTFSLPLSQPTSPSASPRRHFRRIRGLSLLKLHRSESQTSLSDGCPHCPQDLQSQKRAIHRLPCGHRLCTQALRNTVKTAIESRRGAVPSCCRRPIPGSLVEHVMTHEEQAALLEKLEQWDEAASQAPSISSSRRNSMQHHLPHNHMDRDSQRLSADSSTAPLSLKAQEDLNQAIEREDYKLLQVGQTEQRDRFLAWASKQNAELISKHDKLRSELLAMHDAASEETQERHASTTSDAEDKQVKAESDLREVQDKERRDSATALKHMEAYCAGTYSSGELHERNVTEQDLLELEKARWHRDSMAIRHESAINVLRGEQNRRLRLRALRQDRELQDLKRNQRKEELELERSCSSESSKLHETLAEKRAKIEWRWDLQMAILAKKIEAETEISLMCRLPTAYWHRDSTKSSLGCLSPATQFEAADHLQSHQRHDSTTTQSGIVMGDPESKYSRHSTGMIHVQEFKVGTV
ncbi:Putative Zinc finger, RING/FYVE/PHD-type [Septoria linicola]|uniref:Zinc finger, RING/FYVE/PHD-type n=1 Tax=Septoria linicola TaxID=215465 RepID=A0A9Q9ARJ2_9PEZI|nr:putative Zinc finger, RING/FYVE/PHD-type [Septoria linicola]USW50863.1 Putative Zinc finger, RING/FYVE/PHD-type [Septoria linicola]